MEIAAIGNSDFVLGFRLAGIRKTYEVEPAEFEARIQTVLDDKNVGILVMHNDDLAKLSAHMQKTLDDSVEPTVITIGGKGDSTNLRDKIKQAVGVDLWK
jgi:V/A-type H+-transporting ATPase subunit F